MGARIRGRPLGASTSAATARKTAIEPEFEQMMHFQWDAEVVHHSCDRTRLRVPHRRGDSAYLDQACRGIVRLPGVTSAVSNRHNASIIIRHNEEFRMEQVTQALHDAALAAPLAGADDVAEPGGEYFPQPEPRGQGRGSRLAAVILQLAVACLFGTALTYVLELLARNLIHAAFRQLPAEAKSALVSA
jgi:hypothetical protein